MMERETIHIEEDLTTTMEMAGSTSGPLGRGATSGLGPQRLTQRARSRSRRRPAMEENAAAVVGQELLRPSDLQVLNILSTTERVHHHCAVRPRR